MSIKRRSTRTAVLVTTVVTLAVAGISGCSSSSQEEGGETPSETPSSETSTGVPGEDETDPVAFAEAAWAAFFDSAAEGQEYDEWWEGLEPLLSPAAAAVHVYTDPRNIGPVEVTGEIVEAPEAPYEEGVTSEVYVPTNEGRYSLFLARSDVEEPWRLEYVGFPEEGTQ